MLKRRVVATVVVQNGVVVQSVNFKKFLPVGRPDIAIEFLDQWGIDEIILIDITATKLNKEPNYEMVRKASLKCRVPLTVGGGINSIAQITELMHSGADRFCINRVAFMKPEFITEAAKIFGNQCVVVSIDAVKTGQGYLVYDYLSNEPLNLNPAELAFKCQEFGAGEILINSVDRDGSYEGYDLDLINEVCDKVKIPVICSGGAKNANDFLKVFSDTKVCAASAANFFHFTEHSVVTTKANIAPKVQIRLDTHSDYNENSFDDNFRLRKKSDQILEEMLFVRIEKEII